ncbi:hypothetical protein J6590_094157 [Homalodisca vitripennis]|nr:hypothetical protein J6590_094157 [Homalodisca vitripennis]
MEFSTMPTRSFDFALGVLDCRKGLLSSRMEFFTLATRSFDFAHGVVYTADNVF